ncbi:MAG: PhoU domain-containing protein, partial [Clostridium butyricum]|nr:PhoU domain-containing protein [Clostridium butyricum]
AYEGAIFLDLITDFERIGDHSTNIAENVIGNSIC